MYFTVHWKYDVSDVLNHFIKWSAPYSGKGRLVGLACDSMLISRAGGR